MVRNHTHYGIVQCSHPARYLVDSIKLAPSAVRGPHKVTVKNVNSKANNDAKALLRYLGSIYGKKILSGQQDQASLDWVTTNVGKTPAILGVDFMGMRSPS
jgi:mannan endo-1,4-beta-mannosidase